MLRDVVFNMAMLPPHSLKHRKQESLSVFVVQSEMKQSMESPMEKSYRLQGTSSQTLVALRHLRNGGYSDGKTYNRNEDGIYFQADTLCK